MRAAHIKARAKDMVARTTLLRSLADRGIILSGFLNKGDRGATVKQLQHFLAEHGFLAADAVTGTYGEKTVRGVLDFQIAEGIVRSADDRGAGGVGPATLGRIRILQESWILRTVRERGIQAV
jgi:peptidoglycan hydrolase-like protein with peptidoglycan-binding domain